MVRPANCIEFENRDQWRSWLEKNHAIETEAWLIICKKKYQDQGLTLGEAVEEAMCFGWIDGTLKSIDERRYALRYTPRASDSVWSVSNIRQAEKLIAEGKMTAAGERKIAEAKERGAWAAAMRREQVNKIPEDLEIALKKKAGAISAYHALPDSQKKRYIYWLQSAKRDETKRKRVRRIVDDVQKK